MVVGGGSPLELENPTETASYPNRRVFVVIYIFFFFAQIGTNLLIFKIVK